MRKMLGKSSKQVYPRDTQSPSIRIPHHPCPHIPRAIYQIPNLFQLGSDGVLFKRYLRHDDVPDFGPGDTVRVHAKVVEGSRERIQVFEGTVMRKRGGGIQANFTVRRIASHGALDLSTPRRDPGNRDAG